MAAGGLTIDQVAIVALAITSLLVERGPIDMPVADKGVPLVLWTNPEGHGHRPTFKCRAMNWARPAPVTANAVTRSEALTNSALRLYVLRCASDSERIHPTGQTLLSDNTTRALQLIHDAWLLGPLLRNLVRHPVLPSHRSPLSIHRTPRSCQQGDGGSKSQERPAC